MVLHKLEVTDLLMLAYTEPGGALRPVGVQLSPAYEDMFKGKKQNKKAILFLFSEKAQ